jgi:hypothetical protein
LERENAILRAKLSKYKPDKRQTVETDYNKVFRNQYEIRSAEDKRQKRLRPMAAEEQLPIDSFLEKPVRKKRKTKKD